jgi:hypothetical protein
MSTNNEAPNTTPESTDIDDVINFLGEEESEEVLEVKESKKEEETEEKTEEKIEEVDELKELEAELEAPSEEDLELMTPVRRKEILAKYPTLFKDFPYLEKAYYREQQFTELFPTLPDAQQALEKARIMDGFEEKVMQGGNIGLVLEAIKGENPETFKQVVDNLLPSLQKTDQGAYFHLLGNVIKSTIMSMVQEARNLGENGQPLQAAANILNQYVFGTNNFTRPELLARPQDKSVTGKEEEIKKREQEFITRQFETVRNDLQTRADNVLTATIEGNIDPKKVMTDYVRKNATREARESLDSLISKDTRFRALLDKLWDKAFQDKFTKDSQDRIKAAYLSKAKTLLPTVIKKARADALKGLGRNTEESSPRKGPITVGRSTSQSSGKKPGDVPKGMKSIDFLMQD